MNACKNLHTSQCHCCQCQGNAVLFDSFQFRQVYKTPVRPQQLPLQAGHLPENVELKEEACGTGGGNFLHTVVCVHRHTHPGAAGIGRSGRRRFSVTVRKCLQAGRGNKYRHAKVVACKSHHRDR